MDIYKFILLMGYFCFSLSFPLPFDNATNQETSNTIDVQLPNINAKQQLLIKNEKQATLSNNVKIANTKQQLVNKENPGTLSNTKLLNTDIKQETLKNSEELSYNKQKINNKNGNQDTIEDTDPKINLNSPFIKSNSKNDLPNKDIVKNNLVEKEDKISIEEDMDKKLNEKEIELPYPSDSMQNKPNQPVESKMTDSQLKPDQFEEKTVINNVPDSQLKPLPEQLKPNPEINMGDSIPDNESVEKSNKVEDKPTDQLDNKPIEGTQSNIIKHSDISHKELPKEPEDKLENKVTDSMRNKLPKQPETNYIDDISIDPSEDEPPYQPSQKKQNSLEHIHQSSGPKDDESSHFFAYLLTFMVMAILFYLLFHNKQRILAMILEGRSGRHQRRSSRGRAKYHKLDNNLEEAINSTRKKSNTVIY